MKKELLSLAQDIYDLSKKAGLITTESFIEVFSEQRISEFDQNLTGEHCLLIMMDHLRRKGKAFMVNWDQSVEDIVFNFKTVNSDLNISDLGEKQVGGQWLEGMEIEGKQYWYPASREGYVPEVLGQIGKHLEKFSKVIICSGIGDANLYLVIGENLLPEFEKFGFFPI